MAGGCFPPSLSGQPRPFFSQPGLIIISFAKNRISRQIPVTGTCRLLFPSFPGSIILSGRSDRLLFGPDDGPGVDTDKVPGRIREAAQDPCPPLRSTYSGLPGNMPFCRCRLKSFRPQGSLDTRLRGWDIRRALPPPGPYTLWPLLEPERDPIPGRWTPRR